MNGLDLVLPGPERGRNGFEGTFKIERLIPVGRMKTHGFGLFGNRDVQDSAQTATMAVMLDLLLGFSSAGRALLVETAHAVGNLGLSGAIKLTNHSRLASAAVERGFEALDDTSGTPSGVG